MSADPPSPRLADLSFVPSLALGSAAPLPATAALPRLRTLPRIQHLAVAAIVRSLMLMLMPTLVLMLTHWPAAIATAAIAAIAAVAMPMRMLPRLPAAGVAAATTAAASAAATAARLTAAVAARRLREAIARHGHQLRCLERSHVGPHRQNLLGAISRSLYGLGEDSAAAAFAVEAAALHPTPQPTQAPTLEQPKPSKSRKRELLLNLEMFA